VSKRSYTRPLPSASFDSNPWRSWPPPALLPGPAAGIGAGGDRVAPRGRVPYLNATAFTASVIL
jgi:hypothetical protein